MARRRLDDIAVAAGLAVAELERPGALHRAAPHVDRLAEPTGQRRAPGGAAGAGRWTDAPGRSPAGCPACAALRRSGRRSARARPRAGSSPRRAIRVTDRLAGHRIRDDRVLHADGPAAFQEHLDDPDSRHDPGTGRVGPREVDPDPRLLRPARAAERTAAAVAAAGGVPPGRRRFPAKLGRPAEDGRVLRRDDRRRRRRRARTRPRRRRRPSASPVDAREAMIGRPLGPDVLGSRDAGHPVDERPAADASSRTAS